MKITDLMNYILENKISSLSYEREVNEEETYRASISVNSGWELEFSSSLVNTREKLGADSFYKYARTCEDKVLNDEEFNLEAEFLEDGTVLVTLTQIKMGNQNIRHKLLDRLPMKIVKTRTLGEMLLEDFEDKI